MKPLHMIAACLLLALAACSGGSGSEPPAKPPVVTPPASTLDAFFRTVQAAIGMTSDDKEPVDIATATVTEPDASEPEKVE